MPSIHHPGEPGANGYRDRVAQVEPRSLRTYTPTQAVISHSAGVYHWTKDGRRLFDFTSGVLVSNLGHNPTAWMSRLNRYMGWSATVASAAPSGYTSALPMTAYNAITPVEVDASSRLLTVLR